MAVTLVIGGTAPSAQQLQVQEHVLENGLTLLLVPRKGDPNVAAGWVAKVGSVNEQVGITGISHLFEHMMFKGTHVIGTTDITKDLALMERMDQVKRSIAAEAQQLERRVRLGEIASAADPQMRSEKHRALLAELAELDRQQKAIMVKNEFDRIYRSAGASGMNAGTDYDFTIYFINVPANKLELWFWMESDRLLNPVFREFYAERDVVREERRMRVESTPTGRFDEQFDALFWQASPYQWPVIGWPSDLEAITREEARAYYDLNYAPNNLAACLVGDFEAEEAIRLAEKYFGRLKHNPEDPPAIETKEPEPAGERRMVAYAETEPQVTIRYLTVPDGHRDDYALTVMGSILSGRSGRLYKSLVLDQQVATTARAGQNSLKWEGFFTLSGVARPGQTPEQVEAALYEEIEKLQSSLVGDRELQKVKNRFAADSFRRLEGNFGLMLQLLLAENNRGWEAFNEDPKRIDAVTAADIQRVAQQYFAPHRRAVITYYTKAAEEAPATDAGVEGLSPQDQAQVQKMRTMIAQMSIDDARQFLQKLEAGGAPPEKAQVVETLKRLLRERLAKGAQQ
jgi:predicted Zn-dependent peptidase